MPQLPLSLPGANAMPMAQASQLPIDPTSLIAGTPQKMPAMSPPPAADGLMTAPSGAPMGTFPPPGAPAQPPWQVVLQPDGSSKYVVPTAGGDVTLGVNKAPVLPKALQTPQAPTPASQATPAAA